MPASEPILISERSWLRNDTGDRLSLWISNPANNVVSSTFPRKDITKNYQQITHYNLIFLLNTPLSTYLYFQRYENSHITSNTPPQTPTSRNEGNSFGKLTWSFAALIFTMANTFPGSKTNGSKQNHFRKSIKLSSPKR